MTGRCRLVSGSVIAVWLALACRLVQVQWWVRSPLAELVEHQRVFTQPIPARPGDVLDRHGRILATTTKTYSLFVDPENVSDQKQFAVELGPVVGLPAEDILARLQRQESRRFAWIARRLPEDVTENVRALELPTGSWGLREEFRRVYPQGRLAAHLLGWRNIDGVGQAGIERTLEDQLNGIDGCQTLIRDARGFVIEIPDDGFQPPRSGQPVRLTIDSVIQAYAEEQLQSLLQQWRCRSATALVMDPHSGELLAMAARPTFDPHQPGEADPVTWSNPAVSLAFEPGSIIKPLIVARALDTGAIQRDDVLDGEGGTLQLGSRTLHDHRPFGLLSVTDVLAQSSNIGMSKIGQRLGNVELSQALADFGFGQRTHIELPAESAGLVRSLSQWDDYSTGSVSMGQEFAVTPLQMITAFSALANGGRLVTPQLVREVGAGSQHSRVRLATQIIRPETATWIVQHPLVEVVQRGTARRARLDRYTVFGKTGTAQKFDAESGSYRKDRHVTSCLLGGPAESPIIVVLVLVDEPDTSAASGGAVAAPAAAAILERTLTYLDVRGSQPADRLAQDAPAWRTR